jgi:hypothetical protein
MGADRVASAPAFAGLGGTAPITAVDPAETFVLTPRNAAFAGRSGISRISPR